MRLPRGRQGSGRRDPNTAGRGQGEHVAHPGFARAGHRHGAAHVRPEPGTGLHRGNLDQAAFAAYNGKPYVQAVFAGPVSANLANNTGQGR
ncbi:MAG: hypothetical protein LC721_09585 [Actinobacteria bacterium]|nr:hypothetical protein [Actinomycetota bacterium]